MIELYKEFTFEAAHQLAANVDPDHPYAQLHGHSFSVEVFVSGEPDPNTGWIIDLSDFDNAIDPVRQQLDHSYLNAIEGLERPTLENITQWIWRKLDPRISGLDRVVVKRGTCGHGCVYRAN